MKAAVTGKKNECATLTAAVMKRDATVRLWTLAHARLNFSTQETTAFEALLECPLCLNRMHRPYV